MAGHVLPARRSNRLRDWVDSLAKRSPARFAMLVFAGIIVLFTLLLLIPYAKAGSGSASFFEALFTATSAVSVTGLTIVDTATYWTPLGHTIIAIAMQIGGLGVMTLASLLGLAVARHIGLTQKILTATETQSRLGDVGSLLRAVVLTSLTVELVLTAAFIPTFLSMGHPLVESVAQSAFMAISTFNNGGFVAFSEGMNGLATNWAFTIPVILGAITGALGFPTILNISQTFREPRRFSLHTKLTLVTYGAIFAVSVVLLLAFEWSNPQTTAGFGFFDRLQTALFHGATARSAGLSTINIGDMNESTWFVLDILMFIGGGSGGTAGGIKVGTFAVLVLAILAEAHGDRDTEAFGTRIPPDVIRLAISATFLGAFMVGIGTLIILHSTNYALDSVLFETISAFATCGLSTGITASLGPVGQTVLIVLMYFGRVGTMTLAAALALRQRRRVIRFPEERPIIG
ncbi:MAG: potassium transporter TrkG [Actinomycetaceae bacterium]|nr:TrkH family potassium uptake protein [Arcanobacterium sp.]MDD7505209.1 potassium transporter TrkG [Actinomycetaceae bacterium]MDY6143297.1 potassium transporter TrkG [Arcanobacterium sp.]